MSRPITAGTKHYHTKTSCSFFDLPIELREQIYTYVLADATSCRLFFQRKQAPPSIYLFQTSHPPKALKTSPGKYSAPHNLHQIFAVTGPEIEHPCVGDRTKPPLEPSVTRVSKQIRQEALPLFYASYTQPVAVGACSRRYDQIGGGLSIDDWFLSLDKTKFAWIKHFTIHFELFYTHSYGKVVTINFDIDLDPRNNNFSIRHRLISAYKSASEFDDLEQDCEAALAVLETHLTHELERLADDPGIGHWEPKHLEELIDVDREALSDVMD